MTVVTQPHPIFPRFKRALHAVLAVAIGVGLIGFVSGPAHAATHNVVDEATLRVALSDAVDGDVIEILDNVTLTLSEGLPAITHDVTVNGNGHTLNLGALSALNVTGANVDITSLNLTNGLAANLMFMDAGGHLSQVTSTGSSSGLAVSNETSPRTIVIEASTFSLAVSAGISLALSQNSRIEVRDTTLSDNGTGVLVNSLNHVAELQMYDVTITDNATAGIAVSSIVDGASIDVDQAHVTGSANGILLTSMLGTSEFSITRSTISGSSSDGIVVSNLANGARVQISGTELRSNGNTGIRFANMTQSARADISDSLISGNSIGLASESINQGARLSLQRVRVDGNTAVGITMQQMHDSATLNVTDSTVSGNGAGMFSGATDAATINLESTTFDSNGEIAVYGTAENGARLSLVNSTVSGHTAGGFFANILVQSSQGGGFVDILNSTITDNAGDTAVAIATDGMTTIRNSIIAGNGGDTDLAFALEANADIAWSLIGLGFVPAPAIVLGDGVTIDVANPGLAALADNGGPSLTHALLQSSPARDAGDPSFVVPPSVDQRGEPRVQNGRIDIGAFESEPLLAATGAEPSSSVVGGLVLALLGSALLLWRRRPVPQ